MRLLVISLITAILVFGCGTKKPTEPSSGDVQLTLSQRAYETGDTIILTLTSKLDRQVVVGFCPGAEPEKFDHGNWVVLWPAPVFCPDMLPPVLESGATMRYEFLAFEESGTYRFRQDIWEGSPGNQGRRVYSKSFQIK